MPLDSFDMEPSSLLSPPIFSTAYMLQITSTRSFGSAHLSSSSIFKSLAPDQDSGARISPGGIGGIVVAALTVITALVILLTISAYVYWRKVFKKRKMFSTRLRSGKVCHPCNISDFHAVTICIFCLYYSANKLTTYMRDV